MPDIKSLIIHFIVGSQDFRFIIAPEIRPENIFFGHLFIIIALKIQTNFISSLKLQPKLGVVFFFRE